MYWIKANVEIGITFFFCSCISLSAVTRVVWRELDITSLHLFSRYTIYLFIQAHLHQFVIFFPISAAGCVSTYMHVCVTEVPGTPGIPRVTGSGSRGVNLTWTPPPHDGNSPVSLYRILLINATGELRRVDIAARIPRHFSFLIRVFSKPIEVNTEVSIDLFLFHGVESLQRCYYLQNTAYKNPKNML